MSSSSSKRKKQKMLELPKAAFKAEFELASHWWVPLRVADSILTECHFEVSEDGMNLSQFESGKAARLTVWFDKTMFESFECTQRGMVSFDPDTMIPTTKDVSRTDTIEFSMVDGKVQVCVIDDCVERTKRCITSKPIIPEEAARPMSMIYDATIELPFRLFKKVMRMINANSSHVMFEVTEDTLRLSGEKDDATETHSTIVKEQADSIRCEKKQKTRYACDYIWAFIKSIRYNEAQAIKLELSTNKPLRMTVSLGPASHMEFVLAPRVERR